MPSSTNCSEIKIRHIDRVCPQPPFLFGLAVFALLALLLSRGILPPQDSPAFSLPSAAGVRVLLGEGFPEPGVHQYSDGMAVRGVIELTGVVGADFGALSGEVENTWVIDGMALEIVDSGQNSKYVKLGWMTARQRLALGIPLHPDRMSEDDWVTLPGIGAKLAAQIELDRQKFGDYGRFEALDRVKGIGPAKLKALQPFFVVSDK
jgi:competence protein ComEA